jgi:hypothetical protein
MSRFVPVALLAATAFVVGACGAVATSPVDPGLPDAASPTDTANATGRDAQVDTSTNGDSGSGKDAVLDVNALATTLCEGVAARNKKCNVVENGPLANSCVREITEYSCAFTPAVVRAYVACRVSTDCSVLSSRDACILTAAAAAGPEYQTCVDFLAKCRAGGNKFESFACTFGGMNQPYRRELGACLVGQTCGAAESCYATWETNSTFEKCGF